MIRFIVRRLLLSIPVLFAASALIFFSVAAVGDPIAQLRVNPLLPDNTVQSIEARNHLNDPLVVQYAYWLKTVVTDRFGSPLLQPGNEIWDDLTRVLPHTLQLVLLSEVFALLFGIGIGVYSAIRQYSPFDYAATTLSFLGFAMPVFWLALMLQIAVTDIYLKLNVRIFYTSGLSSDDPGSGLHYLLDRLQHLALPALTLCVLTTALYSRFTRASMLEVVNSDFVRTARAKGISERTVIFRHALRNALIPLVTIASLNLAALLSGAVITETVFQLDGMGPYLLQALLSQDTYVVMAWLMVTATIVILFNLIADVAYGILDPKIRLE